MGQWKPNAKIIADSISEQNHRLTTMQIEMHRFVLAEFNTHRAFSRNSASSRAIPVEKIMNKVRNDPAYPVHWGKEQRGMQPGDEFSDDVLPFLVEEWDSARNWSLRRAQNLNEKGLHKSLVNRLLEPWLVHTVICSATEWDNFFWQRCHPDAQPEMKAVADEMQRSYYTSTPKELAHGEWHLPYIDKQDHDAMKDLMGLWVLEDRTERNCLENLKKVSTARCARVSYLTHDGVRALDVDVALFSKLHTSGHWSPFEHVASPIMPGTFDEYSGNFVGWKQFRKEFQGENRKNFVPNLPDLMGGTK